MSLYFTLKNLPELKRRMWRERMQAYWQMGMKPLGHMSVWLAMAITCTVLLWAGDTALGNLAWNAGEGKPFGDIAELEIIAAAAALAALLFYRHVYFAALRQYVGYASFDRAANPLVAWIRSLMVPLVSVVFILGGMLALDLLINSFDTDPAPIVAELKQWPDPIPSQTNGYIAYAGLMAGLQEKPFQAGSDWLDAVNEAIQKHTGHYPKPPAGLQYVSYDKVRGLPENDVHALSQFCLPGYDDCWRRLHKERNAAEAWVASNAELLSRYLSLKKYPQWQETRTPGDMSAPQLPLNMLLREQGLLQTSALLDLDKKQPYRALTLIDGDIRFVRNILTGKSSLFMQAMAANMLARDYALLGQLIVDRPAALKPYGWFLRKMLTPLTLPELSLDNAFRFDKKAAVVALENAPVRALLNPSHTRSILYYWDYHHFNRTDTLNLVLTLQGRQFKRYKITDASHVPPVATVVSHGAPPFSRNTGYMYNLAGKLFALADLPVYAFIRNRVADLNALNRLVRLRLALAERKVAPKDVPAFLADEKNARFHNPETGKPFEWDPHAREIYFNPATEEFKRKYNFGDRNSGRVGLSLAEPEGKKARHK